MCNVRNVKETEGRAAAIETIATASLRPVLGPMATFVNSPKGASMLVTRRRGWNRTPAWMHPYRYWQALVEASQTPENVATYDTVREARKELTDILEAASEEAVHTIVCHDGKRTVVFSPTEWYEQILTPRVIKKLPDRWRSVAETHRALLSQHPMPVQQTSALQRFVHSLDISDLGEE